MPLFVTRAAAQIGSSIQSYLAQITGQRTVPNIFVREGRISNLHISRLMIEKNATSLSIKAPIDKIWN